MPPVRTPRELRYDPQLLSGATPNSAARSAWYWDLCGDRSATFPALTRSGHQQALDLCRNSDLVITNFAPGTMDRLVLGLDEFRKVNPTTVLIEMSGFGATAPLRAHRAYGQTMEAMAGITSLIGYSAESGPLGSGSAYLDPMGGLAGAAAAITALQHRNRTGRPQHVELAQREAATSWIGEIILGAIEAGVDPSLNANAHPSAFPHDASPCLGEEQLHWPSPCSPLLTSWLSRHDSRIALGGLMALFALGNLAVAAAPT
ncbi:CoA transferase [Streptomyces melanosporofaciens]|uniref:CoA transferase n=1 Tax=Streptomyces melanosporofaciens TaxID=67327 RepID=UPI00143023CA|nr:CoA transferase [Streptomyces melanosporofaciens]